MADSLLSPLTPAFDPDHEARTVMAIARAHREIPFYAERARTVPQRSDTLAHVLQNAPLLFKKDIRATLPKKWLPPGRDAKKELTSGELEFVETSGSTDDRLRILWDRGWWLRQEERAMRTNPAIANMLDGKLGPYREAILTTPACGLGTCHMGELSYEERVEDNRLFLNTRADPTFWRAEERARMLDEMARHETVGLESDPAYLANLAEHARGAGRQLPVSGFVQLTYAFATGAHLRAIRRAYAGPVFQLYGASEVGVLFMEGDDGRLHHAPFTTHVELLPLKVPTPGANDVALVVVTTLDRVAQPLVRFVVGDLVQVDRSGSKPFTSVPSLVSVEGRVQDALVRPDGAIVTTGAVDRTLEPVQSIVTYQAVQRGPDHVELDVVLENGAGQSVVGEIRERLAPLCPGMTLEVRKATAILAEPSGKYRVTKCQMPFDFSRAVSNEGEAGG